VERYSQRSWEGVKSVMAPDPHVLMFGTQADEKRIGLDGQAAL